MNRVCHGYYFTTGHGGVERTYYMCRQDSTAIQLGFTAEVGGKALVECPNCNRRVDKYESHGKLQTRTRQEVNVGVREQLWREWVAKPLPMGWVLKERG